MKNLLLLFAFIFSVGSLSAQKVCSKSKSLACSKANVKCLIMDDMSSKKVASALAEADIAANDDESIEKRVCSKSGAISYFKTSTCAKSGKISKEEVLYDVKNSAFVNVSPSDMISDQEAKLIKVSDKTVEKSKTCSKNGKKCCASKKKGA